MKKKLEIYKSVMNKNINMYFSNINNRVIPPFFEYYNYH